MFNQITKIMKANEFLYRTTNTIYSLNPFASYKEETDNLEHFRNEIVKIGEVFPETDFSASYNSYRESWELLADFNIRGAEHWYVIGADTNERGELVWTLQENLDDGGIDYIKDGVSFRELVCGLRKLKKTA